MASADQEQFVKFIETVEKHECLYNYKLSDYSRKDVVEKAWVEVAKETSEEVGRCKEKLRNIRTVFMRRLKGGPSGSKRKKPYYLYDSLQFVISFLKTSTTDISGNISSPPLTETQIVDAEDLEGDERNERPSLAPESEHEQNQLPKKTFFVKKRKIVELSAVDKTFIEFCKNREKREEKDPKRAFLISLLPDLHPMDNQQMRKFKRGVMVLVDEILEESSRPSTTATYCNTPLSPPSLINTPHPSPNQITYPSQTLSQMHSPEYNNMPPQSQANGNSEWWLHHN